MQLREVQDVPKLKRAFLQLPVRLYRDNPYWVRPLDKDIEKVFDRKQNKFFRHGECVRWVLEDDAGQCIGRVAAFVDRKTAHTHDQPTGGMGFFECVDNPAAATTLFDACRTWLEARDMEAMDGPINFGDRNQWWGLLIDGYDEPPNYGMFYHLPYYRALFEAYGFREYYQQFTFARKVMAPLPESVRMKAERIRRDADYTFAHLEKKRLDDYAEQFRTVYNQAWVKHQGVGSMKPAQARALMNQMKPVLDEDIIWFAYYKGEPVGFFIMLPELNQIFRHVNGRLDWLGKLKFVYHRWRGTCTKMFGVVFGIVPAHQGKGLEGAIVQAAGDHVQYEGFRYEDFEMNWIGDFNPKMIHLVKQVGGEANKVHATYRKLFDETRPFRRHALMD
ncbi:MAG: hypothetical protein WBA12_03055 [Catalinimonas sp.]